MGLSGSGDAARPVQPGRGRLHGLKPAFSLGELASGQDREAGSATPAWRHAGNAAAQHPPSREFLTGATRRELTVPKPWPTPRFLKVAGLRAPASAELQT